MAAPRAAIALLFLALAAWTGGGAWAAEGTSAPALSLELNRLEQQAQSCRAAFVARNGFATGLSEVAFELVLFNRDGLVDRMTVFDFGAMPTGKTVVRRFDLPDTQCGDVSRILVNGPARCKGDGIAVGDCGRALSTSNRTDIEFGR